jgi:hypothetical protein
MGIPRTARQEKMLARARRDEQLRMAQLYREVVLKEPPRPKLVQIHPAAEAPAGEGKPELAGRREE